MIVVYNGNNDLGNTPVNEHRFVHRQLRYLWDLHEQNGLVNWNGVLTSVRDTFGNTMELIRLASKFFALRGANADIEAWKKEYRKRAKAGRKKFADLYAEQTKFYLTNMEDIILSAKKHDIPLIFAHQPNLMVSKKKLIGKEKKEFEIPVLAFFAVGEKELEGFKSVPTYRIQQSNYRHFADYQRAYRFQNNALSKLCKKYGISCVDIQEEVDRHDNKAIYFDSVHLTATGNKIAGQKLAASIKKLVQSKQ